MPPTDAPRSLPEIDFATFILSLASSALIHLGEMTDPAGGGDVTNLPIAKQTIDIIAMLADKTKGNVTAAETQLLSGVLYDLRVRYVDAQKAAAARPV